eukprot:scaffold22649_cov66-Cyclotella_meneghiniana.AAC.5
MRFYFEPIRKQGGQKGSCSDLVELFAFPENELSLPDSVKKSDRQHCRRIVHDLSKCLSNQRTRAD